MFTTLRASKFALDLWISVEVVHQRSNPLPFVGSLCSWPTVERDFSTFDGDECLHHLQLDGNCDRVGLPEMGIWLVVWLPSILFSHSYWVANHHPN